MLAADALAAAVVHMKKDVASTSAMAVHERYMVRVGDIRWIVEKACLHLPEAAVVGGKLDSKTDRYSNERQVEVNRDNLLTIKDRPSDCFLEAHTLLC